MKNMRLIDADALMELYADRLTVVAERYSPDSSECGILSGAMKLLEIQPTIEERKTGKWILCEEQRKEDTDNGNYRFYCSNCGYSDLHVKSILIPYCWHCGADMRGEEDG